MTPVWAPVFSPLKRRVKRYNAARARDPVARNRRRTDKTAPTKVRIPAAASDQPRYGQIGVIVGICFAIGIVWPFLAGVQLVPRAPVEEPDDSDIASTPSAERPKAKASVAPAPVAPKHSREQRVEIEKSVVASCKDSKGRKLTQCDHPDLGPGVTARIQNLANCSNAKGLSGVLSLGLEVDFEKHRFRNVTNGKSTTLPQSNVDPLLACAKHEFASAVPEKTEHDQSVYEIYYFARFIPPGTPLDEADDGSSVITPASGTATVVFETAMIREQAQPESKVVARLLYGTRVYVTGKLEDWFEVKYDSKGHKGWVHKSAIGMD